MAWLSDEDVEAILTQWGVTVEEGATEGSGMIGERLFEQFVGYRVGAIEHSSYRTDPPSGYDGTGQRRIQIQPWSEVESVSIYDGDLEAIDEDGYYLEPYEFPDGTIATIGIRFKTSVGQTPGSIVIGGTRGLFTSETVPSDIKRAAALMAASSIARDSATNVSGNEDGISEIKQGAVTIKYGGSLTVKNRAESGYATAEKLAMPWKLVRFVG